MVFPRKFIIYNYTQKFRLFNFLVPSINMFKSFSLFFLLVNTMKCVLLILRESLFTFNQRDIFASSEFNSSCILFRSFPLLNKLVPSANNIGVVLEHMCPRSFMYYKNSNGPSIEPWGTPHVMLLTGDDTPL